MLNNKGVGMQKIANRAPDATGNPAEYEPIDNNSKDFFGKSQGAKNAALALLQVGLSVIPANPTTKKPTLSWKPYQAAPMSRGHAVDFTWPGIAVICGKISEQMETLDFDFKAAWFATWAEIVEREAPGLVARLTRQTTQSGGKHIIYRCPGVTIPGNTKLASERIEFDGPGDHDFMGKTHRAQKDGDRWFIYPCYIETRGEGGYFLAAPTEGYHLERGDFQSLAEVTPGERDLLIRAAKALDKTAKPTSHKQPTIDGTKPGDHYNQDADPRPLLEKHGWAPASSKGAFEHWTRPGKNRGISASLIDGKLFNCFTTNGAPLEEKVYTPFALYSTLEHNGDFEAAARELRRQGYGGGSGTGAASPEPDESPEVNKAWAYARELIPRTPYPWEILPSEIAESLRRLARACASTADPLPGFSCAFIAAAVGRKVAIAPKGGWVEPLIFWFFDLHDSGEGKTAKMRSLAWLFMQVQRDKQAEYDEQYSQWAALPKRERGDPPGRPRGYYFTNLTLEGVHAESENHPTGGMVAMLNEASTFIGGQNEYKAGKGTDREAWLSLHDGNDARIIRAAKSVLITGARIQIIGGIQPAVFRRVFGGDDRLYLYDGTIYRGLYTYNPPRHHPLTLESWSDSHRETWERTLNRAMEWADAQEKTHVIPLNSEAQNLFLTWRNKLDQGKTKLPAEIRGFLPKTYGTALRLAGVIDILHTFYEGHPPRRLLDAEGMQRGIDAAMFYLGQAVDAMRLILGDELTADPVKARILEALQDRGEMTTTDINNDVFQRNQSAKKLQAALNELVEAGQVTATTEPTGGRAKTKYAMNEKNELTKKDQGEEELNSFNSFNSPVSDFENNDDEGGQDETF
jgi:DNA-binding PadR family transcriptional regulator